MHVVYKVLTGVQFEHEYNRNRDFRFMSASLPEKEADKCRALGIVMKSRRNGFDLYYDAQLADINETLSDNQKMLDSAVGQATDIATLTEKTVLLENDARVEKLVLSIELRLTDPHFFNYTANAGGTDGFEQIKDSLFYFTNSDSNLEGSNYLHETDFVDKAEYRFLRKADKPAPPNGTDKWDNNEHWDNFNPFTDYPDRFFSKPFGIIKLKLLPGLKTEYSISFRAKETKWKYIVQTPELSTRLAEMMEQNDIPAIVDNAGKRAFGKPEMVVLNSGSKAISFTSDAAYPARAIVKDTFSLVSKFSEADEKYKRTLVSTLPFADYTRVSQLEKNNNEENTITEIYL